MVKRKSAPEPDSAIEPSPKRRSSRLKSAMTANVREFPVFRPLKVSTDSGSHLKAEPVGALKSLQDLPEMPLDIIHEVLGYLDPQDLFNLLNSTRGFRSFLLKDSSAPLWTTARANVPELPPFIKGMDEVSYASLLFDKHCEVCQVQRPNQQIDCDIQMRICSACRGAGSTFLREDYLEFQPQPPFIDKMEFLSLIPSIYYKSGWMPEIVQDYLAQYEEMVTDADSFDAWKEKMKEERGQRDDWSFKHRNWLAICEERRKRQMELRREENDKIRSTRCTVITGRLLALGWKEDDIPPRLAEHPYVKKYQQLTDQEWMKIGPTLVEYLKTQIQEAERSKRRRD
ncbi:hypothetical protein EV359DRAFT_78054 [Lentinula novae-zelandiae]|nr:hypothetical protein EV359DRAFT_78054 [Lentinula novae-zelandiae]